MKAFSPYLQTAEIDTPSTQSFYTVDTFPFGLTHCEMVTVTISLWEGNTLVKSAFGNYDSEYKASGIPTLHPGSAAC